AEQGSPAIDQLGFRQSLSPAPAFGQLTTDATFTISVNGGQTQIVTVAKNRTDGSLAGTTSNATVDDLVDDINAALAQAGLGSQIQAGRDGSKVVLGGLPGVTSFTLTAAGGNSAVTQIGFGTSQTAVNSGGVMKITATNAVTIVLRLKAAAPVSGF